MSRLLALLAASASGSPATDDGGTITPAPVSRPGDGIRAAIVEALDPARYGSRVFTVGVDAPTITATLALADAVATSQTTRALVLIPPGQYVERVERPHAPVSAAWTDVRSTTLDPADVQIIPPSSTASDVFAWEHYGTLGILAGLSIDAGNTRAAIHCGEWAGRPDEAIYYRLRVTGSQASSTGGFSWGVGPGQHVLLLDCEVQTSGIAVAVHNFDAAAQGVRQGPGWFVMDNVTATTTGSSATVLYLDLGSGQQDRFEVRGGKISATGVSVGPWETDAPTLSGHVDPAAGGARYISCPGVTSTYPPSIPAPDRLPGISTT